MFELLRRVSRFTNYFPNPILTSEEKYVQGEATRVPFLKSAANTNDDRSHINDRYFPSTTSITALLDVHNFRSIKYGSPASPWPRHF